MSHESYRFLFATWEGGGNIPPVLTVVRKLVALGHKVRVMSDRCNRLEVEAAGGEFIPWLRAPSRPDKSVASEILRDWDVPAAEGLVRLRDVIMCGPALGYAQDLIDELARRPADLVVSSEMLFGVMAACEAKKQPLALFSANLCLFPVPGLPPFGAGLAPARTDADRVQHEEVARGGAAMLAGGLPALNQARQRLGLRPLADVLDQLAAADRLLLATSQAFDFPAAMPDDIRYVGPQLDELPFARAWTSPWPANDPRPLVLVSFSTTFQNQATAVQRVVDAAASLPVRAVVTLGHTLFNHDVQTRARNVHICQTAPHDRIMRHTAAVVTHGGHGTMMRALAHRVPVLCLPMGRDQNDNAARLVFHGAGLAVSPDAAAAEIAAALNRLLVEPGFAAAAQRLGDAIARDAASSMAVDELTEIAWRHARHAQGFGLVKASSW